MIFSKKTFPNTRPDSSFERYISFTETGIIRFTKPCYGIFETGGRLWFRLEEIEGKGFIIAGKSDDAFSIKISSSSCDMTHKTMVEAFLKSINVEKKGVARFELGEQLPQVKGGYAVFPLNFIGHFEMRNPIISKKDFNPAQ